MGPVQLPVVGLALSELRERGGRGMGVGDGARRKAFVGGSQKRRIRGGGDEGVGVGSMGAEGE